MATSSGRVPMLDDNGRFPDRFAPPSVAVDAAAATQAKTDAQQASTDAQAVATGLPAQATAAVTAEVVAQVDPKVTAAQSAQTGAVSAKDAAVVAKTAAETAKVAAEAVGATNDTIMAAKIQDPASATATALSAAIGTAIQIPDSVDKVFSALDMRENRTLVVACASDSTADREFEWFYRSWYNASKSKWPERPVRYQGWDGTNNVYPWVWTTFQDGGQQGAPNKVLGLDTFSRTAADIIGSSPDTGAGAYQGNAGGFSVDGARAKWVWTGAAGAAPAVFFRALPRVGSNFDLSATFRLAFTQGVNTQSRLFIQRGTDSTVARFEINISGITDVTCALRKVVAGVTTTIATFPAGTIPTSTPGMDFPIGIKLAGTTLTATVNGATVTAELAAADVTAFTGGDTYLGFQTANAAFEVDNLTITGTESIPPSGLPWLNIYNSSAAGKNAQWQIDRVDLMYPEKPDLLFISHGHNYLPSVTPTEFLANVQALVDAISEKHGGAEIPVCLFSQNPRFAPADRIPEHQAKQAAIREYASKKKWGYIGSYEAFSALPDGGKSLILTSDGVHPTTNPDWTVPTGAGLQANTAQAWVEAQSRR